MDNWYHVRRLARQMRARVEASGRSLQGEALVQAAIQIDELTLVPLSPDNPLLGGARAFLDSAAGMIAFDDSLPKKAKIFSIVHEIGHQKLHSGLCFCHAKDINETPVSNQLPYAEGAIETYNARQRRETEANIFAAEFLMPADEVRRLFVVEEKKCSQLAAYFGVSKSAMLNQMATVLFIPTSVVDLELEPDERHFPSLDKTQIPACQVSHGPILIDAGPGTGKTLTLVHRVLYLLQDPEVHPENILALTFSNKATSEMQYRLANLAPDQSQAVTICTFHAFCLDLLRQYASQAGLPTDIRVLDPIDAVVLLERNIRDLGLVEYRNLVRPNLYLNDILRAISRAKDELVGPEKYMQSAEKMLDAAGEDEEKQQQAAKAIEVARVYHFYQNVLRNEGLVDFGDLIVLTVSLLQNDPTVLADLRHQYRHILVDEYQDINRASAVLLKLLANDGQGLWAVGDLRQAIYRFRGASPSNIGKFEEDYPSGHRLNLRLNHRSAPALVLLFSHVAKKMGIEGLLAPDWQTERKSEEKIPITFAVATNDQAEIIGIAENIKAKLNNGWSYHQQAILCRTNAQAATMAKGLEEQGIPVLYLGNLFERSEVKDMLALLSLACEGDGTGLVRVAQIAEHFINPQDVQTILVYAQQQERRFYDILANIADINHLDQSSIKVALNLANIITSRMYETDAWAFLAYFLFEHSSYARQLLRSPSVVNQQRLLALGQLLNLARGFSQRPLTDPTKNSKLAFLNYVRHLIASQDPRIYQPLATEQIDAVRLLTIHASKGLEFPVVYLPNLSQRRFPPQEPWSPVSLPPGLVQVNDEDKLVEEVCLFFVALSRAKDELIISRAERYGKQNYKPSPLLDLILDFSLISSLDETRWEYTNEAKTDEILSVSISEPSRKVIELSITDIEGYWRCPKQYYYARVLRLREPEQQLGYKQFHTCVYRTINWMDDLYMQGEFPQEWRQVEQQLEQEWETAGPVDHVHEALYKETARQMLHQSWQGLRGVSFPVRESWVHEALVELDGCQIRLRIDHAEVTQDQKLRLVRYQTGKVQDDDRKQPRLALYREAARQLDPKRECLIDLHYLSNNAVVTVSDQGQWEKKRLDKIAATAQHIAAGNFPPDPDKRSRCLHCSFFIVCPGPSV